MVVAAAVTMAAAAVFSEGTIQLYLSCCPIFHLPLYTAQAYSPSLLNTLDQTTKDLPIVGGVTSPLLKTVSGVTDGLPIVGSGGAGRQRSTQAQPQAQRQVLTEEEQRQRLLEKKRRMIALKKQQLALEAAELDMED